MSRLLNVGIMQFEISNDYSSNLKKVEENVKRLMNGFNKPEIILGPELAFGKEVRLNKASIEVLSNIAKENKIYFLPGSMLEEVIEEDKTYIYNSLPILDPSGELIDVYRKICPYYPAESMVSPGNRPVVFDIKEKNIKIGVMNCHDWCFPEISRNLTLLGAEILFRPSIDPEGLYDAFHSVALTRALENQAFFISLNACKKSLSGSAYGHSMVTSPEGRILYEAGNEDVNLCITLDMDIVEKSRRHGTFYTEQLLRQLKLFDFKEPFGKRDESPLLKSLRSPDLNYDERKESMKEEGI